MIGTTKNHYRILEMGRVIKRSIAKQASRRYQTTTDLRNELEDLR